MRGTFLQVIGLLSPAAIVAVLGACAGSPPLSNPIIVGTATTTIAPASPTATLTPEPTPMSTPPIDAVTLWRQAQSKHQTIKSARGFMEIQFESQQTDQGKLVTMTVDFEFADPDMHMRVSSPELPGGAEVEAIAKGNLTYLRAGRQWLPLPAGDRIEGKTELSPVPVDRLDSYLTDASDLRLVGRRTVRGVDCHVISFSPSPESLRSLADLRGQASRRALDAEVTIEEFQGEVAIGTEDGLLHQMAVTMSGHQQQEPEAVFRLGFTISLWDLNSPDISVEAPGPEELLTFAAGPVPTATPTPAPLPLHAYRSSAKPTVDGVIGPMDGWDQAESVHGPYADGTIEIKALHDGQDLYLLLVRDDSRYRKAEGLNLLFEDGGIAPQRMLDGKNDDCKYVGVSGLPEGYRDAAWSGGWRVGEPTDGITAGRHSSGKMVVEWRGPLNSGEDTDIGVVGDETLGFAVVNWSDGRAGSRGAWPPGADVYKPDTWGSLVIHR